MILIETFKKALFNSLLGSILVIVLVFFSSCSNKQELPLPAKTVTVAGSESLCSMLESGARKFMENNKDILIKLSSSDSRTALHQLSAGSTDIALSDTFAAEQIPPAQAIKLKDYLFCAQGFSIIVNDGVQATSLSTNQLINIFTLKTTNWKTITGQDLAISPVSRPDSCGFKTVFRKYVLMGISEPEKHPNIMASTTDVLKFVAGKEGAVAYIPNAMISSGSNIKTVKLNNSESTNDMVKTAKYPFWSYGHALTSSSPSVETIRVIQYMTSKEFSQEISNRGNIPLEEMQVSR